MDQTELIMKIYYRLSQANVRDCDEDFFDAGEDIVRWLVKEIPQEIRDELDEEAYQEIHHCPKCGVHWSECEC